MQTGKQMASITWLLPAAMVLLLAGAPPFAHDAAGASATFTIVTENDDAFGLTAGSQNYGEDYILAGKYTGYSQPYLIGAFRFDGVTIPQGATISNAYLRLQAYLPGSGPSSFTIVGEDYDTTAPFDQSPYIGTRSLTSASASWTVSSAWLEDGVYNSPDIKAVVQEIVDRGGWTSGNALGIQLRSATSSGGYQVIYSVESAASYGALPAQLVVEFEGDDIPVVVESENYIPGAKDVPSSVPTYLNNPDMYYDSPGGICWATCTADILAYWDRTPYAGVTYWNLIDHGTAPLRQSALPTIPGHDEADVAAAVFQLAEQYYGEGGDEAAIIEEFCNQRNGLAFNATYHGPVSATDGRVAYLAIVKSEIDAGRPIGLGSWGTYFGGPHQVPAIGYKWMSNTVSSTVYIHRNTGGTQSEYVSIFASGWGNLDMDRIVPGGSPVDLYELQGNDTPATAIALDPDDVYGFRQTHSFNTSGDEDWVRLSTVSGRQYTIETRQLGPDCDTVLALFHDDGVTQAAQDDDGGSEARASKIVWRCWTNGTFLVRATNKASGSGHTANYDLEVAYESISNADPVGLAVSNLGVQENRNSGTLVGILSTTDPDYGDTFTYTLVSGAGDDGNGAFFVDGDSLRTAVLFNREEQAAYNVRLRTTDRAGGWYEESFTVTVLDEDEAPTLTNVKRSGDGAVVIQWSSATNHFYTVQTATNLMAEFSTVVSNIPATPTINVYTASLDGASQRFWRIFSEP